MNTYLRSYPDKPALINDMIETMIPLDKDIVVFRKVNNISFLPKTPQEFISNGYLSTTLDASGDYFSKCKRKKFAVMRIKVPKGIKAIWVPSHEYELIFSHGITMRLNKISDQEMVCFKEDDFRSANDTLNTQKLLIYDIEILLK